VVFLKKLINSYFGVSLAVIWRVAVSAFSIGCWGMIELWSYQ